jgi:hypothetical protein
VAEHCSTGITGSGSKQRCRKRLEPTAFGATGSIAARARMPALPSKAVVFPKPYKCPQHAAVISMGLFASLPMARPVGSENGASWHCCLPVRFAKLTPDICAKGRLVATPARSDPLCEFPAVTQGSDRPPHGNGLRCVVAVLQRILIAQRGTASRGAAVHPTAPLARTAGERHGFLLRVGAPH